MAQSSNYEEYLTLVAVAPKHEANDWIASQWMGKEVHQYAGSPDCIGRTGKVVETMWDEKGALHCHMEKNSMHGMSAEFWCPAVYLEII